MLQVFFSPVNRTQPYGDSETLTYNIDDLIIDTISYIHQPIIDIDHSKTFKYLEFGNLAYFQEEYHAFFDFPETQAGGFGPHELPETNLLLDSIPSPRFNLTFGGSMASNQWWLIINALAILGP